MAILAFIAKNWRLLLGAVVAIGLAYGGFWLKGTIAKAQEVDRLTSINTILQKRHDWEVGEAKRQAGENILLSAQLKEFQDKTAVDVETVTKTIKVYIHDDRACDIPIEVLKGLNVARGQP